MLETQIDLLLIELCKTYKQYTLAIYICVCFKAHVPSYPKW